MQNLLAKKFSRGAVRSYGLDAFRTKTAGSVQEVWATTLSGGAIRSYGLDAFSNKNKNYGLKSCPESHQELWARCLQKQQNENYAGIMG